MKYKYTLLVFFYGINLFATDRFVDPNLSQGNGTTLFTTISDAVAAAVNGDRILIAAGTYNEPTLTLNKSLTLLSQTEGTSINFNGNIEITGFPDMKLEILGFNLGVYSISSNIVTGSSSVTKRAKVSIIDCQMTNLSLDQHWYELNCIKSEMTGETTFRFGNFVVSSTNSLSVTDEPLVNLTNDKILIAASTISGVLRIRNDDYVVDIANNFIKDLRFWKWNHSSSTINLIRNNEFENSELTFGSNPPRYNFEFSSNLFSGMPTFFSSTRYCSGASCGLTGGYGGYDGCYNDCWMLFSGSQSIFPQANVPGEFKWTYNGINLPCTTPSGSDPLVLTKIIGPTGTNVDAGNPNHDYYDIDLTINDRGRTGGPYSILNYNPSINSSSGKAYIFDLEMPSDLFPGQQVDIKAKGYHLN